jgi:hypothetical protein
VRRGKNEVAVESLEETFADRAANTEKEEPSERKEIHAAFLGALAAAALAYVGLRLVHPQDAAFMVLVWQFGSVVVFASVLGAFGRWLLPWRGINA